MHVPAAAPSLPVSDHSRPGWRTWALLAPMVLWLLVFVVIPGIILFVYSFCERDEVGGVIFNFSFDNYRRVFDPVYLRIFVRSIGYAALTTVLCVVIGYPVAYYIGRATEELRNRLLLLVMVPFWTSFLIRTYAWITILKQEGLLNGFIQTLNLGVGPFNLLYTPTAVVIGLVYAYLPFMILPIYGSVGETRQRPDRGRVRSRGRSDPRLLRGHRAADPAGHRRRHAAGVRAGHRHVRHHRPDGRGQGADDRQRHPEPVPPGARLALRRRARGDLHAHVRPHLRDPPAEGNKSRNLRI